jgi:hypothetical protein
MGVNISRVVFNIISYDPWLKPENQKMHQGCSFAIALIGTLGKRKPIGVQEFPNFGHRQRF